MISKPKMKRRARCIALALPFLAAQFSLAQKVNTVPKAVEGAISLGTADPSSQLHVRVWLNMRNKEGFDDAVDQLYTPGSPTFHRWMSSGDLANYAPTTDQIVIVKKELEAHGLSVTVDQFKFALRAEGTVAQIESAFNTQIGNFQRDGRVFHSNITTAHLAGPAGDLVAAVSGLDNVGMRPMIQGRIDPQTHQAEAPIPFVSSAAPLSSYVTTACFSKPRPFTFTPSGEALPVGVYFGNVYNSGSMKCGYGASDLQSAYGLKQAYKAGLEGAGQTIVIVDAFGSTTILKDANAFSKLNGLPLLDSSNFKQIYPEGPPPSYEGASGWEIEIALDVEWAHAVAPRAKIILVSAAASGDEELQYAIYYAAMHKLGSVISNSYGSQEIFAGPGTLDIFELFCQLAAARGISVNVASGDAGDFGLGTPVGASQVPADAPHATSVGGTSLGIPNSDGGTSEIGWGNNVAYLNYGPGQPADPPYPFFNLGTGGGESRYFKKPAYQKMLPGTGRQQPDVSALADPFTGGVIIYTDRISNVQYRAIYGGTSLACPIFSGIWALANEKAGHWLGQAAPIIATLGPDAIKDIVPQNSLTNPAGTIFDWSGPTYYSPGDLLGPLYDTSKFVSAIWDHGAGRFLDISFGTDTSLTVTRGWDNVTGFGTPRGLAFIDAAAAKGK